jgi:nicotinic acid mononucleotide adenylyltransferase
MACALLSFFLTAHNAPPEWRPVRSCLSLYTNRTWPRVSCFRSHFETRVRKREQMSMEFLWRPALAPRRAAVFPGAWNPPTVAHLEIARAALRVVDQVVWVIPRSFPHKGWHGAGFEERCEMIRTLAASEKGFAAAISDGGLYVEIAREAREAFGAGIEIGIVCGRDAAERMETWDYGRAGVFEEMLRDFRLLVAARVGEYSTAFEHGGRIHALETETCFDDVSSSEVRRRIRLGEAWEPLVPAAIRDRVNVAYRSSG